MSYLVVGHSLVLFFFFSLEAFYILWFLTVEDKNVLWKHLIFCHKHQLTVCGGLIVETNQLSLTAKSNFHQISSSVWNFLWKSSFLQYVWLKPTFFYFFCHSWACPWHSNKAKESEDPACSNIYYKRNIKLSWWERNTINLWLMSPSYQIMLNSDNLLILFVVN